MEISKKNILDAYSFDASLIKNKPKDVVFPKTKEELIEIIKECIKNDQTITMRGSGTSLTGAATPSENAVVISCEKLKNIEIKEDCVVCEPGVVVNDLNQELLKIGKFFPIEPSSKKVATIGGMTSTNSAGLRAHIFGKMCDWIIELTIIDGNGNILKVDPKEFCGSEGILGAVIEVNLKITKPIEEKSYDLFVFDDFKSLIKKVKELKNKASILETTSKNIGEMFGYKNKYCLICCYIDESGEYRNCKEIIEKRESLYPYLAQSGNYLIEDPQMDLNNIINLVEFLEKNNIPFFGHIGAGILHPCFNSINSKLIEKMYDIVKMYGGKVSGEHGYGIKKAKYIDQETKQKWLNLKKKYDPKNLFNPGKLIEIQEKYSKAIIDCSGCGMCKVCPIYQIERNEVYTPRGKFAVKGSNIFACTLCKKCEFFCPSNYKITENILKLKEYLVSKGFETENGKKMIEKVRKYRNPFGENFEDGEWYCC